MTLAALSLVIAVGAAIAWSAIASDPGDPAAAATAADAILAPPPRAVPTIAADVPSRQRTPAREARSRAHGNPSELLFDLSLPEEARMLCPRCDPFRKEMAGRFDESQRKMLFRIAQFSLLTEGEVWRLAAREPTFLETITPVFRDRFQAYEADSHEFFEQRSRLNGERLRAGQFETHLTRPRPVDVPGGASILSATWDDGSNRTIYRVVQVDPGDDDDFDLALAVRQHTEQSMTLAFNQVIRRYL